MVLHDEAIQLCVINIEKILQKLHFAVINKIYNIQIINFTDYLSNNNNNKQICIAT